MAIGGGDGGDGVDGVVGCSCWLEVWKLLVGGGRGSEGVIGGCVSGCG